MIELPWPPRELHPNARPHYHAKASAAKAYREAAYWTAYNADPIWSASESGFVPATVSFYPPDKRRRDLDGMLSNVKAGLDGIADAYRLNDFELNPITIRRCEPVKGGLVVVTLGAA